MIDLVLVDFDDTIVDTGPRFQNARRSLLALLRDAGFPEDVAYDVHYNQIDPAMRTQYGLGPRRMEPAFVATYERLCALHGEPPRSDIAAQAAALGRSCYGAAPVFAGALTALKRLADTHPTLIYTQSGDIEYQLSCVRSSGIIDIINEERVHICGHKDADEFQRTINAYGVRDAARAWMIGNSMRSDINPALEAGANAILVETADPWEHDLVDPHSPSFHRVPTFPHAVDLLLP
ncbi:MAG TPA: HAD family hydrolase [Longimicrobiales bacterium]|nr:HAD family hydrolase [Longimicrobiales bacterium]